MMRNITPKPRHGGGFNTNTLRLLKPPSGGLGVSPDSQRTNLLYICFIAIALLSGSLNSSCTNKPASHHGHTFILIDSLVPKYSHSFRVDYYDSFRVVRVFSGKDNMSVTSYVLCPKGFVPMDFDDAITLCYPAKRVACMSTTHVGALKLLNARNLIVAATNTNFICDSAVCELIKQGLIKDAGKDYQPDYEAIAQVRPDLLFSDGENSGSSQMYAKMKALGINVVCSRDYFEQGPLARAEWIKFFAAFIGKEKLADSIFHAVQLDYQDQINKVAGTGERPTVFCNLPYSGVWYMPCGENYVAKLITDAGGKFLWNDDKPMNGLNLTLNFEQVYQRATNADFWINPGTDDGLGQIASTDAKFKLFKAYKSKNVFNYTNRLSAGGGMDIWETGTYTPNIVLRDLALIFHSHGPLDGRLYYYKQLK
jgi:iron complex transport system substrate-binding protein